MQLIRRIAVFTLALLTASAGAQAPPKKAAPPTTIRELVATSKPADWRALDPEQTLYLELASGRVVIELSPIFAPRHVANIVKLAHAHWYDGLAIVRTQDDFVVQWGDPLNSKPDVGEKTLPKEFVRSAAGVPFARMKDVDTYAPEVGYADGMPAARSSATGDAWPVHCYGMVGVGRDNDPATAIGTELYVVIGHAPRQLDRNTAVVGRVVWGIELLSSLPRGTGGLGFYEQPEQRVPIQSLRVAADVPAAERSSLEVMRTDTPTFQKLIEMRRNRKDTWYQVPAGRLDVCNLPMQVRERAEKPARAPERKKG